MPVKLHVDFWSIVFANTGYFNVPSLVFFLRVFRIGTMGTHHGINKKNEVLGKTTIA